MGLAHSPKIVTNDLVFLYDMGNPQKSWKGKPTTNYCYLQNPRIDSSYIPYVYTTSGSWQAKHPDAITVYNQAGTDISAYVNTGVGDWTNTYHAIWTYDAVLNKPVVTMRDLDGQWKAKSFGIPSMSSMGLTHGSTYSISWLQWTSDVSKCVWAGIYQRRASDGAYNFWDGLSGDSSTSYNTLPNTWQRVYATFTVTAGMDLSVGLGLYMYGMYGPAGTLKISDVQLETGTASGFHNGETRSNTQALLDLTKRNTITATSLTYTADGTFSFDGSGDYAIISTFVNKPTTAITCEAWIKPTKPTLSGTIRGGAISATNSMYLGIIDSVDGGQTHALHWANQTTASRVYSWNGNVPNNGWSHIVGTYDGSTMRAYLNGVQIYEAAQTGTIPDATYYIGTYGQGIGDGVHDFNGSISQAKIYNRALTAAEIQQNFNALRGKYGI